MILIRLSRVCACAVFLGVSFGPAAHGQDSARLETIRGLIRHDKLYEAEIEARALMADTSAATGEGSIETARTLDLLVETLLRLSKGGQPETRQLAERALLIKRTVLPVDDPDIATSLVILGQVLSTLDDYTAAK